MRILSSLLFLCMTLPLRAEVALRFCFDPYPPYTIEDNGELIGGLKVQVLEDVMHLIDGVDATVQLLPWKRCQESVRIGQFDGILPLFDNDERREYMVFTDPVFTENQSIFFNPTRQPELAEWSGDAVQISGLRLGMLRGSYIDTAFEAPFEARGGIERAESVEALMLMLTHDRIDIVATDLNVGRYIMKQAGLTENISWSEHPITSKSSGFGLSKATGADAYLGDINKALDTLRTSGQLQGILEEGL